MKLVPVYYVSIIGKANLINIYLLTNEKTLKL